VLLHVRLAKSNRDAECVSQVNIAFPSWEGQKALPSGWVSPVVTTYPCTPEAVKKWIVPLTRPCESLSSSHPSPPVGARELTLIFFFPSPPSRGERQGEGDTGLGSTSISSQHPSNGGEFEPKANFFTAPGW